MPYTAPDSDVRFLPTDHWRFSRFHRLRRPSAGLSLLLTLVLACAPAPAASPVAVEPARSEAADGRAVAAARFSARAFHGHVAYLASDELEGRGSGTRGNDLAAEYIAQQFRKAGLRPGGENGTYFQPFEVTLGQKLTGEASLVISGGPGEARYGEDFVTLPFSSSERFEGPLAFAGYGITNEEAGYDDYAGFDANGKVLLILRYEPHDADPEARFGGRSPSRYAAFQSKARTAREQGAAALLIVNPPLHRGEEDTFFAFDSVDESQNFGIPMMQVSRRLAEAILRAAGAPDLKTLQNQLDQERKTRSLDLEGLSVRGNPGIVRERATTRNVIGLLPGAGSLAEQYVVIGAHYDHLGIAVPRGAHGRAASQPAAAQREIHNGADDNASGTAGLILLAEYFAGAADEGDRVRAAAAEDEAAAKSARRRQLHEKRSGNRRSLVFIAFSGEEMGLLGSMHYVNHPTFPLEQTAAMLNMDMIGRLRDDRLQVFGIRTAPQFEPLVKGYAEQLGFELQTSAGGFGPSDHTAFYGKKIPVMHFFTGIHSDYHRPSDDTQEINVDGAVRVLELIAALTADLREMPERPEYVAIAEPRGSRTGLKVRMGVMPSYADDEQPGMQIDGVSPGSPAEKAGLQSGDRLLMIGSTAISNVYDLMDAMSRYEPGDEANLTVLRGGERVQMAIKFEAP